MTAVKDKKQKLTRLISEKFMGDFVFNEPLAPHTWYKIGGPADVMVYPKNVADLKLILVFCKEYDFPVYFLGEGANTLVSDAGFQGVVVKLTRFFNSYHEDGLMLTADAGVSFNDLILYCENKNLGGMEYFSGIPGSVGGMLMMNAGTSKGEIGDIVEEVYYLDDHFNIATLDKSQISFGYRYVEEFKDKILLGCRLHLLEDDADRLKKIRQDQVQMRAAKQPLEYPSCGSVFKRPANHYVGKLVQDAGLKGFRYGQAKVPEKHAGFIVNSGNASANEIMYIIRKVQDEVYKQFQVELEPEVKFLGF